MKDKKRWVKAKAEKSAGQVIFTIFWVMKDLLYIDFEH